MACICYVYICIYCIHVCIYIYIYIHIIYHILYCILLVSWTDIPLSDLGGCGGARLVEVWDLLQNGSVAPWTLSRMLDLLGDSPWVSHVAEQLHAAAAMVSRHHPDYFLAMLLSRCMLVFVNKLLPRLTKDQVAVAGIRKKLAKVKRRCPEKLGCRQICFGDLSKLVKARVRPQTGKRRKKVMQNAMKAHAGTFARMNRREKASYEARKLAAWSQMHQDNGKECSALASSANKLVAKIEKAGLVRQPLKFESARWTAADVARCAELQNGNSYSRGHLENLRVLACKPPPPMLPELVNALDQQPVQLAEALGNPPWAKEVCRNREAFHDSVFVIRGDDGDKFFKFNFAMQTPQALSLTPLVRVTRHIACGLATVEERYDITVLVQVNQVIDETIMR